MKYSEIPDHIAHKYNPYPDHKVIAKYGGNMTCVNTDGVLVGSDNVIIWQCYKYIHCDEEVLGISVTFNGYTHYCPLLVAQHFITSFKKEKAEGNKE